MNASVSRISVRLGIAHWIPLILLCLALAGCTAARSTSSPETMPDPSGAVHEAPKASSEGKGDAQPEKATSSSSMDITSRDGRTSLLIFLPADTEVEPEYTSQRLKLAFEPAVPPFEAVSIKAHPLIKELRTENHPASERVKRLELRLDREAQFLISRQSSREVKVSLIPKPAQEKTEPSKERTASSTTRLQSVDFTQDSDGKLHILLKADNQPKYALDPSESDKLRVAFPNLIIPSSLRKIYRLHKFNTPLTSALLQDAQGSGQLVVSMKHRVPVNISRQPKALKLSFTPGGRMASASRASKAPSADAPQPEAKREAASPSAATANATAGQSEIASRTLFPGMQDDYSGRKISIDLQDAEVEHVLRLISEVGGFNLVLDQEVSGRISLKLDQVPWDQALDLVLLQRDLGMVKQGKIVRIAPIGKLQNEQERIIEARKAALEAEQSKQDLAPLQTEYIQINYSTAAQIEPQISKFLSDRGQISHDARTNQLIVSDTRQHIAKVRSVIQKLDRPERQVLIEARLVYATDSFQRSMGLQWSGEYSHGGDKYEGGSDFAVNLPIQGTSTFGLGGFIQKIAGTDLFTLDAQLDIGESQGQVKTISSPRVVTLNNQRAEMVQGTLIATKAESESGGTTTEYTEATLKLSVQPQITPDDKLILELDISDDSPAPGGGEDIETRSTRTKLIVQDGETIVIGGVQQVTETTDQSRVPGISNVPFFGWLFKNRSRSQEKRELLIFIRPKIL